MKAIKLQSWAGVRYEPVEVVGETPKRLRVKILNRTAKLAGRCRWAKRGDVVLVPKYAVVEVPDHPFETPQQPLEESAEREGQRWADSHEGDPQGGRYF